MHGVATAPEAFNPCWRGGGAITIEGLFLLQASDDCMGVPGRRHRIPRDLASQWPTAGSQNATHMCAQHYTGVRTRVLGVLHGSYTEAMLRQCGAEFEKLFASDNGEPLSVTTEEE